MTNEWKDWVKREIEKWLKLHWNSASGDSWLRADVQNSAKKGRYLKFWHITNVHITTLCPNFKQISQPSFPSASLVCQANVINISMTTNTNWVLRYHRNELWSRNSIQDRKHAVEGCPYHHLKKLLWNGEWYCYRSIRMEAVLWVTWEAYKRTSRTRNMSQIYLKTSLIQLRLSAIHSYFTRGSTNLSINKIRLEATKRSFH